MPITNWSPVRKERENEQAAASYERGLNALQDNSFALRKLSYLYLEHFPAKADRVILFAQKALARSPGDPNILDILGLVYFKKGDYNKSLEYYKQAYSALPNEPYFLYQAGIVSMKAGDAKNGKAYLRELVQKYPDHELSKQANKIAKGN
jgi:tetratricopeptide (TPR) repeat protein